MTDTLFIVATIVAVFGPPCFFLAMGIRHFIPLMRGMKVPWYANALGPLLFFQDKYLTEQARPHRVRFLVYETAFIVWCLALFLYLAVLQKLHDLLIHTDQGTGAHEGTLLRRYV